MTSTTKPTAPVQREQLRMGWPRELLDKPPRVAVPSGYALRTFRDGEEDAHQALMVKAGFTTWNRERLEAAESRIIPDGFFVIEHVESRQLVATCMVQQNANKEHPFGGELGWVAGDPAHAGRGLGLAVCAAATASLLARGYREIYLKTDDWRLPAIKTYLKLGYVPKMFLPDMEERWRAVRAALAGAKAG